MPPFTQAIVAMAPNVSKALWLAFAALVLTVASFFCGASWKASSVQQKQAQEQLQLARDRQIAINNAVIAANKDNQKIINELREQHQLDELGKKKVIAHLDNKRKSAERKVDELEAAGVGRLALLEVCSDADLYRLDRFTLRLFNQSGSGLSAADRAGRADAEGRTLTGVDGQALVEHAIEVRAMYGRLAARCDKLVDKVQQYQEKQVQE
jgi:hypothetical protein